MNEEKQAEISPLEKDELKIVETASGQEKDSGEWYEHLTLEDAEVFIRNNMVSAARNVIAIGYYLKHIRNKELYLQAGYATIWDYASEQYGFSKSTTSRYMSRNDKFSKGGNSPVLDSRYQGFSKAQLQEMLSLDQEQIDKVTADMTVAQIREMRKPKEVTYYPLEGKMEIGDFLDPGEADEPVTPALPGKQMFSLTVSDLLGEEDTTKEDAAETQQNESECCENSSVENEAVAASQQVLSAYGTPVRVWPECSLIATEGCEGGHYCDSCSLECEIRQKDRQCVEAPCGNPFPCDTLHYGLDEIRNTVGNSCEFINHELAYHRAGDGEAAPCCKHCTDPCEFICSRAMQALDKVPEQCDAEEQQTETEESELSDIELIRGMLEKENKLLDEMIKVDAVEELPKNMLRKKKLLVGALAGMLCDLDMPEPEEPEQPELPLMKNNDQRKAWLRDYKSWGLWYTDEHIGCRYYKYDFDNGARLIAEVYIKHNEFTGQDYESSYLHLVGGPEPEPHPTGAYGRWNRHERYNKFPNSETELVEFLKVLQRGNRT